MRWFIGVLVAVNLAILLWGSLRDEQPPAADLALPGVGSIRLLGEAAGPQPPAAVAPAPAADQGDAVVAGARPMPSMPAPRIAPAPEASPVVTAEPATTVAATPDSAPEPPAVPGPESPQPAAPEPPIQTPAVPQPVPAPRFCSRVGPFADAKASQPLRDYLVGRGAEVTSSEQTISTRVGFWVLVPPQASRAAARELAARLKAEGIDYWIIPKGALANAISLGVFSRDGNANDFAKEIRAKGFDVEVRDKNQDSVQVWLEYSSNVYVSPTQIRAKAPEGVGIDERDCP